MMQFKKPIPVVIKETKQVGYAIYAESGGMFENDLWTVVLCEGGIVRHYRTDQIVIYKNATFDITDGLNNQ